jgi:predicted GNAT family acetyltransferase
MAHHTHMLVSAWVTGAVSGKRDTTLTVDYDETQVIHALCLHYADGTKSVHVQSVVVHPNVRRQGHATALLKTIRQSLAAMLPIGERGSVVICACNESAGHLARKAGFEKQDHTDASPSCPHGCYVAPVIGTRQY